MVQLATARAQQPDDPNQMQPGAPPSPPSAAPAEPDADQQGAPSDGDADNSGDGTPNVAPEEQAAYDTFVKNGMAVIYNGGQVQPSILKQLSSGSDPIGNLANATVQLVIMLQTSAEKAGQPVPDDVLMHGAKELMEDLAEVAGTAKIHTYTEKEIEGAWYRGLDLWRQEEEKAGKLSSDDLKAQFGEVQQADQQGKLNQVLPGIDGDKAVAQAAGQPTQKPDNGGQ